MTKLTIQLDCKTYRVARKYSPVPLVINTYIESGDLVELQPQEEKPQETVEIHEDGNWVYANGVPIRKKINELEKETKPEVNYCDSRTDEERARDMDIQKNSVTTCTSNVWTPTPGEMIEVSNDGEKWEDRPLKFKGMNNRGQYETWIYSEGYDNKTLFSFWNYARPAPEELKLEKLPEFTAIPSTPTDSFEFSYTQDIGKQVQALTTTVNLLIDKLNNK